MGKYFGTDGIRGEVGKELTVNLAYKVGCALKKLECNNVVIAYDTRESNLMLFHAIRSGAEKVGLKVHNAGVLTTPGLYLYSLKKSMIGVMITASHNPYMDNGIKIFLSGRKLTEELETLIEDSIDNCFEEVLVNESTIEVELEAKTIYVDFLSEVFKETTNLKIGLDAANGSTSFLVEEVFSKVADDLTIINNTPTGRNINENCGATKTFIISELVKQKKIDIGFSFDGDGDRMLCADKTGRVYYGDEIAYIIAKYLKESNMLFDDTIVLTKMSNIGIINSLKSEGIKSVLTNVGDKYVLAKMLENNYSIGGENSGHTIIYDQLKTGDGMLTALYLLKILTKTNMTLEELTKKLIIYPDRLDNLKVRSKKTAENSLIIDKVAKINEILGEQGLLIVRASGTENLIRVSCCAKSKLDVDMYVEELVELVKSIDISNG